MSLTKEQITPGTVFTYYGDLWMITHICDKSLQEDFGCIKLNGLLRSAEDKLRITELIHTSSMKYVCDMFELSSSILRRLKDNVN